MPEGAIILIVVLSIVVCFLSVGIACVLSDCSGVSEGRAALGGVFTLVTCGMMILFSSLWYHDSITPKAKMDLTPSTHKQVNKKVQLHQNRPVEALLMEMDDLIIGRKKPLVVCDATTRRYFPCTP